MNFRPSRFSPCSWGELRPKVSNAPDSKPTATAAPRLLSRQLAELGLGRDPLNAALDGAQDAMGEMAVALAQSILHPIRSMEDLAQQPGRWTYKKPTTDSKGSLDYQEQVTGRPAWWVYMIGKVEFELGWLLVLSPEPMTASNPEHVALTARVRERLDRADLIERPEPEPSGE
jgi:hypothetical protein